MHTVAPVVHGVGYAPWSQRAYGLKVDEPALDLFLFDGSNGAQLIGQYTALTGRAPVPPLWRLGLILSKAYYRTAEETLAVAREVRARGMPCDTITFDGGRATVVVSVLIVTPISRANTACFGSR